MNDPSGYVVFRRGEGHACFGPFDTSHHADQWAKRWFEDHILVPIYPGVTVAEDLA